MSRDPPVVATSPASAPPFPPSPVSPLVTSKTRTWSQQMDICNDGHDGQDGQVVCNDDDVHAKRRRMKELYSLQPSVSSTLDDDDTDASTMSSGKRSRYNDTVESVHAKRLKVGVSNHSHAHAHVVNAGTSVGVTDDVMARSFVASIQGLVKCSDDRIAESMGDPDEHEHYEGFVYSTTRVRELLVQERNAGIQDALVMLNETLDKYSHLMSVYNRDFYDGKPSQSYMS